MLFSVILLQACYACFPVSHMKAMVSCIPYTAWASAKGGAAVERMKIGKGLTRILLRPEDAPLAAPVVFSDGEKEFLSLVSFISEPRPVYRLGKSREKTEVRQTANGEVVAFSECEKDLLYVSRRVHLSFACPEGQILTGLGQHEEGLFDYAREKELLYQHNMKISIPFLLSSEGWGLLIEAGCASVYQGCGNGFSFTLDAARSVSFVVIRGVGCADVLQRLSFLVGRPALLPKWAYGYVQSKERYHSAKELMETAREFRCRGLGLDCIVLDWMSWKDGCWGDKEPDPERFPDIPALTETLHGLNVRLMVSVWPNISAGLDREEMEAAGAFLPASQIYDAFSSAARDLYWRQCMRYWMSGGVDALWCDSCEPFTDPDWCGSEKRSPEERMRLITEASGVRLDPEVMNDYGAAHLRGLRDHWLRDFPARRPVLLARSGGIDSSALGAILWSGDICARWDVLQKQVTEGIKAACSGIAWWTLDIGGFFVSRGDPWFWRGDYPDGVRDPEYRELYLRWFQFGCMLPVFRSHGTDTPREPWAFGTDSGPEYNLLRRIIGLRYRLLPYIYSSAAETCRTGLPMIQAMMTACPEAHDLAPLHDQYLFGHALLVKPVTRPLAAGGSRTDVMLPPGGWYDLFTLEFAPGGLRLSVSTPLGRFPLLVRAGSILPLASGAHCASEAFPVEIWVFCGADGSFSLYDDAGDGAVDGSLLCMRYTEASGELMLAKGGAPLPLKVRFVSPDGSMRGTVLHYEGNEIRIYRDALSPVPEDKYARLFWEDTDDA